MKTTQKQKQQEAIKQAIIPDQNLKTIFIVEKTEYGYRDRWCAPTIEEKESLIESLEHVIGDITEDLEMQKGD